MNETEATKLMLITYAETQSLVTQGFYQELCLKAVKAIGNLQEELADYKIGCDSLRDTVRDLRDERDKLNKELENYLIL